MISVLDTVKYQFKEAEKFNQSHLSEDSEPDRLPSYFPFASGPCKHVRAGKHTEVSSLPS